MGNTVNQPVEDMNRSREKSVKWFKSWKFYTITFIAVALVLAAISYYQATHFNADVTINGVKVSGLTAEKTLETLQTTTMSNEIYVGDEQIIDGKDTQMEFSEEDLPKVKKLLKDQWTFFPSFKTRSITLLPSTPDPYRSEGLKKELEQKLASLNQDLTAPVNAEASLKDGEIIVSESKDGKQYDVAGLLEEYEKQGYTSEIRLNSAYLLPVKEDSEIIQDQKNKIQALLDHTVNYQVQDKVHSLKGSDLIKNASLTEEMQITIDNSDIIKEKIAEINDAQSTLGKDFNFKTHSGGIISVKGKGYGWALDVKKETALIKEAFEKGEETVSAANISGNGWSGEGYGYDTLTNNGIGDTYAEVSIADQRIWLYRDGKLVLTTNVVTGKLSTGEGTSPGVWYILYKRTPYTLKGSAVGNPDYEVDVSYWAPFTNSGQGFHDASWRGNWSGNAFVNAGSGGCVNVQPGMMKQVYDNLSTYQPVVVY
ncbi:L,D-transpeptidase family protein [Mesobacillus maritimus]|uniref:L,D-transpeptidase family protein n=1 Tax=Mesobacillus maritimus TaxID=1643336 RepID=UPI00384E8721